MKNITIPNVKKLLAAFLTITVLAACDKDFGKYNLDPDAITTPDPGMMFSSILVKTSAMSLESRTNYTHAFMQYGYANYWSGVNYAVNDSYASQYWGAYYGGSDANGSNVIKNLEYLITTLSEQPEYVNTYAAARVWRVYAFQKLTDFYGDIPYNEAGKAIFTAEFTPMYDTQEDIYENMIEELRAALQAFDASAKAVQGDQFYKSSADPIGKWKKLANSILLRIGMRLIKVDPTRAEALVQEAVTGGVMESNDDMPVLYHNAAVPNGLFQTFNAAQITQFFYLHNTLVTYMKSTGDPRLPIYGAVQDNNGAITSTDTDDYIGYSYDVSDPAPTVRITRDIYYPASNPFFDFQYAQVEFLLAEAVLRNYISGTASDHYAAGITAHMKSLALLATNPVITDAEITTYLANNPLAGTPEEQIQKINEEFWVSCFAFDADEAWANWRRVGYPVLDPNPSATPSRIPRKMVYPVSELNTNTEEYLKALARYDDVNDFNGRVWWDTE